jgi:hypothetical protein
VSEMKDFKKLLRGLGWIGKAILFVGAAITTNWAIVLSSIAAATALTSKWAANLVASQQTHTAVFVFLSVLWSLIGVVWLKDRNKPIKIARTGHLEWGLTQAGFQMGYNPENEAAALQLSVILSNSAGVALRWEIENFSAQIRSRTVRLPGGSLPSGVLPWGPTQRAFALTPFPKSEVQDFFGKRTPGTIELSIAYGFVDGPMKRRLKTTFNCEFLLGEPHPVVTSDGTVMTPVVAVIAAIGSETDEAM